MLYVRVHRNMNIFSSLELYSVRSRSVASMHSMNIVGVSGSLNVGIFENVICY